MKWDQITNFFVSSRLEALCENLLEAGCLELCKWSSKASAKQLKVSCSASKETERFQAMKMCENFEKKMSFHLQERIVRSHYAPLCSTILLVTACDVKIWHHVLRCSVEPVKELNLCEIRTVENCSSKKSSKSNGATTRRHVLENPSTQLRPLRPVDLTDAIHVVPQCPEPRRARLGTSQGRWRRKLDKISFCSFY